MLTVKISAICICCMGGMGGEWVRPVQVCDDNPSFSRVQSETHLAVKADVVAAEDCISSDRVWVYQHFRFHSW